tara:strand:- start:1077 stop:1559 length:483 start_codon:yes stop_codon:yes gene_type:complete
MKKSRKDWYIVMTKPKQEFIASKNLLNQGFDVFLPRLKKSTIESPSNLLFPSYIFVSFDILKHEWLKIGNTRGVKRLLNSNIKPSKVNCEIINILFGSVDSQGLISKSYLSYKLYQNIKIINGPFKNIFGKIISLGSKSRIKILSKNLIINLEDKDIIPA